MADAMEIAHDAHEINLTKESRMLYALGKETLLAMRSASVLIVGLRGLGLEIAKNVVLAGIRTVGIMDDESAEIRDMSSHFFLSQEDVGKPRAAASHARLQELNRGVHVSVVQGPLTEQILSQYKTLVYTNTRSYSDWTRTAALCRVHGIHFISADVYGLTARAFVDLGPQFTVVDTNGEQPAVSHVGFISQDTAGSVRTLEDHRHHLETGDYVRFREVQGMTELNELPPMPVKVTSPYSFSIGDTTGFGAYQEGGIVEQVKMPKTLSFEPLDTSIWSPAYVPSDFAKLDRQPQLHLGCIALSMFYDEHGRMPHFNDEADAAAVIAIAQRLNMGHPLVTDADGQSAQLDARLLGGLARTARADISPMAAFLGGIVAQEVMKASSGKFTPIVQWFYFDALECLPDRGAAHDFALAGTRYDDQVAVFGQEFQRRLANLNVFTVGAGAIGCELLKNHALMGLGTGPEGQLYVTDMDTIEVSNLNRQFLFRDTDVQKLKSETAARVVKHMNPDIRIRAYMDKVGPETEETFDDEFWERLDVVCNALDNVPARMYVDERCRYYARPLLESGTLGTKGNVQVVVPHLTETYSSSRDPPEKETPMCTIKNFPYQIDHTIHRARELFETLFTTAAEEVGAYLSNPDYIKELSKQAGWNQTVERLHDCLAAHRPRDFADCIAWARLQFEEQFNHTIAQLLFSFPPDMLSPSGARFWSGTKRVPTPLVFEASNPLHLEFIRAAANLRARMFNIQGTTPDAADFARFAEVAASVPVPAFVPRRGVKIQTDPSDEQAEAPSAGGDDDAVYALVAELPKPDTLQGLLVTPIEFEKDDDSNWHMQFITAASNCRATNYSIPLADLHETRRIAGRIIPAIVTTTAMVAGLVCLELYKVIQRKPLDQYKNAFANLALPFFGFSEPIAAPKRAEGDHTFSLWDFIDVREGRDLTIREFIEWFKTKYEWDVSMISSGVSVVYLQWWAPAKREERLAAPLAQTVMSLSKQKLSAKAKTIMLQVCCEDKSGAEREIPDVRYFFR